MAYGAVLNAVLTTLKGITIAKIQQLKEPSSKYKSFI